MGHLEELRQLTNEYWTFPHVRVLLFGSWARGEAHLGSDVDLAIDYPSQMDYSYEVSCFREILEESAFPCRVDVVDLHHAGESLCQRIRKEGILWRG